MALDVDHYKRALYPHNIFDFLPEDFVREMMRGFFLNVNTGVALFYAEQNEQTKEWQINPTPIHPFDLRQKQDRENFAKPCLIYYNLTEGARPGCCESDLKVCTMMLQNNISEIHPYQCWLGFHEFAFPLTISNKVRAVILSGQVIPPGKLDRELIAMLIQQKVEPKIAKSMMDCLQSEQQRRLDIDPQYGQNLRTKLGQFGAILQKVVDRLYMEQYNAARDGLCKSTAVSLASYSLDDQTQWNNHCAKTCAELCQIMGALSIQMLERSGKYFVQKVSFPFNNGEAIKIHARDILPCIPEESLIALKPQNPAHALIRQQLPYGAERVYLYRNSTSSKDQRLNTLMAIYGLSPEMDEGLIKDICETICLRFSISSLVFLLRVSKEEHVREVGTTAHSLRTPLQLLSLDLEELRNVVTNDELRERLNEAQGRIIDAQEDIRATLENLASQEEVCDFVSIVDDMIKYLTPLAQEHLCLIQKIGIWPMKALVFVDYRKMRIAVMNLIQNAIKYSYKGNILRGTMHEIRISLRIIKDIDVKLEITNYGIGIPKDFILSLGRILGQRAEVFDKRKGSREGTGWGLPTAMDAFESYDGKLEIDSIPADNESRSKDELFHRYLTTVRAFLPVYTKKEAF